MIAHCKFIKKIFIRIDTSLESTLSIRINNQIKEPIILL